ncbi:hypothetical protein L6452_30907 [Arctium lappa]|uniref:Uncharacterized protein n=1 Tax=Arctium lappa TaxID=4217 RepID=A0ACB8ZNV5_ARCLA|nr:hypothetical protein L6452_30907 [Arctium lappa]
MLSAFQNEKRRFDLCKRYFLHINLYFFSIKRIQITCLKLHVPVLETCEAHPPITYAIEHHLTHEKKSHVVRLSITVGWVVATEPPNRCCPYGQLTTYRSSGCGFNPSPAIASTEPGCCGIGS